MKKWEEELTEKNLEDVLWVYDEQGKKITGYYRLAA